MSVEGISGKVLIDTNVLIYATLSGDKRHNAAFDVLNMRLKKNVDMFISVQNLAEMYPNLTGPKNQPSDSPELARAKISSIAKLSRLTVLPITYETTRKALKLCEHYGVRRQDYFDMQLVAAMQLEGIPTLITENASDFAVVETIHTENPF